MGMCDEHGGSGFGGWVGIFQKVVSIFSRIHHEHTPHRISDSAVL